MSAGILEFAAEQQATREGALEQVRSAEGEIRGLVRRFAACTESFLRTLDATPDRVIVRYEPTRRAVLAQLNRVNATREFLAHARWSERLVVGTHIRDKAAVAREVLGHRHSASDDALCTEAVGVLDDRARDFEQAAAALGAAREAVLIQAKSLRECAREMSRRGVIAPDDRASVDLEETLSLILWRETAGAKRRTRGRVERLLSAAGERATLRGFLKSTLETITAHAEDGALRAIERERRNILREASRMLAARLAGWRPHLEFGRCERAILALHFMFTSARSDLGGLPSDKAARCEAELEAASGHEVRSALNSLSQCGLLQQEDVEVFRYVPSVWRAAQRRRRSHK